MLEDGTLAAFGLFMTRTSALVLATPFFGAESTFGGVKVVLIASLALISYTAFGVPLPDAQAPLAFAVLAMREVLIGLSLALVLQFAMLAVRVSGEMIGQEMAFNMASVVDPATGLSTPLVTQLYEACFMLGLLAVDGHHLILRALGSSFERAPVGAFGIESDLSGLVVRQMSQMFAAGVTFAAPVLVLLSLTSIVMGLLARTVPQMNVLEIGFTLRIVVGLLGMTLFSPLIAPALEALFGAVDAGLETVLGILGT
jgi:flagellar biosynthetic protein FliR